MSKFEVAITKAQKNAAVHIDAKDIIISYFYPDEENPFIIEGECNFSSTDWSQIPLSSKTKFELACVYGTQRAYISLGHADPSKDDFNTPRTFKLSKQNNSQVTFVLHVYEDKKSQYIATSNNIRALKINSNEE